MKYKTYTISDTGASILWTLSASAEQRGLIDCSVDWLAANYPENIHLTIEDGKGIIRIDRYRLAPKKDPK